MAYPVLQSVAVASPPGFGDASLTFTKPASTASDDLLLVHIAVRNGTGCTPPSGWTAVDSGTHSTLFEGLYWKIAGGSEPTSYTFGVTTSSGDRSVGEILRVTGADGTTPINAEDRTLYTGSNSPDDSPTVTTTVADCLCFVLHGGDVDPTTSTVPSGTTQQWKESNSGQAITQGATFEQASAGSTGAKAWTISGFESLYALRTVAIAPSGGGGGATGNPWYYYAQQS